MTDTDKNSGQYVRLKQLSCRKPSNCYSDIFLETESDITIFVKQFKKRIQNQLDLDNEGNPFLLFDEIKNIQRDDEWWLNDNQHRFIKDTPNERLVAESYLSELGYICSMTYSPDGNYIITGHSTGLIQVPLFVLLCLFYYFSSRCCYDDGTIDCCCCTYALIFRSHDSSFFSTAR